MNILSETHSFHIGNFEFGVSALAKLMLGISYLLIFVILFFRYASGNTFITDIAMSIIFLCMYLSVLIFSENYIGLIIFFFILNKFL